MAANYTQSQKDAVLKFKLQNDFLFFTRYFFKNQNNKKFVIGEHHRLIANKLKDVIDGKCKRLIINIAPRYGKTELAVKAFIAYGFAINPRSKFLHVSYSQELAVNNSEEIRDNFILNPEYNRFFDVGLKPSSTAKKKWETKEGGVLYATATGGQVTGFGAGEVDNEDDFFNDYKDGTKFSGAVVIDDPIKPEDADHETIRNKVNNRYESTLKNRVNSVNTPIVLIMQRLHEDDLCGHLIKEYGDEWEVLSLPCIKEDETPLWEFKHDIEWLKREQKKNPTVFGRQYMQNPMPSEGVLFPKQSLNWYDSKDVNFEDADFVICANDVADQGSDSYSMPIGYMFGTNVYIEDVLFNKQNLTSNESNIKQKVNKHGIKLMTVETNGQGKRHLANLRATIKNCSIIGKHNTANKESRILNEEGFIKINFYFKRDYEEISEYANFIHEITTYLKEGRNAHDDAVDSLALLSNVIYKKFKRLWA